MKAIVLVVFLALLIAGVFVSDGVVQKKVIKTIPLQSTSTEGMTEQDEAEGFNHLYGTGFINNGDTAEQDQVGQSDISWGPLIYREKYGYISDPLGIVVDQAGQTDESISEAYSGISGRDGGGELPGPLLHQDKIEGFQFAQPEAVSELAPSTIVYVGGTTVPLSSYQTTFGKYLWIDSSGLRQYMSIPQYSSLPLMAFTSTGGPGEILEMFPSTSNQGTYLKTYYNFNPGYNRIPYRGDVAGRHYLLFSMGDQSSNAVIIDVGKGMIGDSLMLGTMPS